MTKDFSVPINGKAVRMTMEQGKQLYTCLDRLFKHQPLEKCTECKSVPLCNICSLEATKCR